MPTKKFVNRIILSYLLLAAVAAPVLWILVSGSIESFFVDRLAENLRVQASMLVGELSASGKGVSLEDLSKRYKGMTGSRVTIIDFEGKVLGDSDEDPARMENHLGRPEVRSASVDGWGRSTRYSNTLKTDMLYVAVAVKAGDSDFGFLRLSMPLHQVEHTMASIERRVSAVAFVIFLTAIMLGIYFSRNIAHRVAVMAGFTKAVASGDFHRRLKEGNEDEFGLLAKNLNDMATQLKDKMDALTKEKATLEAVLGGMAEGVLVTDSAGNVILANRSLRESFDIKKEDALGRPFLQVIRNIEISDLIRLAYERREFVTAEVEVQFPRSLSFSAGCVPLGISGEFAGAVLVLHDITRLKALERVRRDFVANVTHELKTPVSAIQGFSETLLDGAMEDKENARRFLGIIETNARRLSRLIEDLMTISKLELGEVKLDMRPVSINRVTEEAAALLEPRVQEKSLSVELDVDADLPKVLADRDRLYQVVLNILDNAVKYTPQGGSIKVSAKSAGDMVELSVADTGPGIPTEMLPRMGERFFRVDAARSRELGGTGLGLAIVKHIVGAHGGRFTIVNNPIKGACVAVSFKVSSV
jgi:two-component system phosphate regulon sensor histidine kinase PhoR